MKKRLLVLLAFSLTFIFLIIGVNLISAECTDSDGGKNYYVAGTNTLSSGFVNSDSCSGSQVLEYYCSNNPGSVSSLSTFSNELYTCPNGCKDGACIVINDTFEKINYILFDSEASSSDILKAENFASKINQDLDKYMQFSVIKSSETSREKLANKLGIFIYGDKALILEDFCVDHADRVYTCTYYPDYILVEKSKKVLNEMNIQPLETKLTDLTSDDFKLALANTGAMSGCIDSDEGINLYEKGSVSGKLRVDSFERTSRTDFCIDMNRQAIELNECSGESCGIGEAYCDNSSVVKLQVVSCPDGCNNGACICNPVYIKKCENNNIKLIKTCDGIEMKDNSSVLEVCNISCKDGKCQQPEPIDLVASNNNAAESNAPGQGSNGTATLTEEQTSNKNFFVKFVCRIFNLFNKTGYESCIQKY